MAVLLLPGLEVFGKRLILVVILVAVSTAIALFGEVNSNVGVLCMLASTAVEATRLVMTQILLVGLRVCPSKSGTCPCPVCLLTFIAGAQKSAAVSLHAMSVTLLAAHASRAL